MERLHERIQHLEQKLVQLLEHCSQQSMNTQKLQQENEQLRQMIATQEKALRHSSEQVGIDTVIKQLGEQQRASMRKMISSYIKDIDQCIAFFERIK